LRDALRPVFPDIDPGIVALGPVVGTYSGPDAVGVACLGGIARAA
jgi:fatty acid-binding protein DegV